MLFRSEITSDTWTTYTRTPFDPALPTRVTTITRAGNVSDTDIPSLWWVCEIDPNPCSSFNQSTTLHFVTFALAKYPCR